MQRLKLGLKRVFMYWLSAAADDTEAALSKKRINFRHRKQTRVLKFKMQDTTSL